MRNLFSFFIFLITFNLFSQSQIDTSIVYKSADEMPLVSFCAVLDTTYAARQQCSQEMLLRFIYANVQYPDSARLNGIEGTVVINFVVSTDSLITNTKIIRDIGGECGAAALYVVNALNYLGLRWKPGKKNGVPVKVEMNIPIKFKLKDLPPYTFVDSDTVYVEYEKEPNFKGGPEALEQYISKKLTYPSVGNDSCLVGSMDLKALIQPDGVVKVLEMSDYSNLGTDFQFEAISVITSTIGQWEPATYQERPVPVPYQIRLDFKPTDAQCATQIANFELAEKIAVEGTNLFNEGKTAEGIAKISEAIVLTPKNAEFLHARGQMYMELKNYPMACEDLTKVREILLVTWVDQLLPVICKESANK